MRQRGPRLGWLIGGLGGLCWLPALGAVWAAQGNALGAGLGFGLFVVGVVYLFGLAPWRRPRTPIGLIYAGLLAIVLAGAAVAWWQFYDPEVFAAWQLAPAAGLGALLIPFFTFGRKTWSDLHGLPAGRAPSEQTAAGAGGRR